MKGLLIIGTMFALLLVTVPANAVLDCSSVEKLCASETQKVDVSGAPIAGAALPTTLDCSSVAKLCSAETQKVDVSGAHIPAEALKFKLDCSSIEKLCPAETQK